MTWLTLMPGGRPELVRRDDGTRMVLGDLALDAELGALVRDQPPRLGEQLAVHGARPLALLEKRDRRIRVALDDERQALLRVGLLLRGRGRRAGFIGAGAAPRRPSSARTSPRPASPRETAAAPPRARTGRPRASRFPLARLLEVLGHDRAAQALLGPLVAAPRPADGQPAEERRPSARAGRGRRRASETWVASGIASSASARQRRSDPVAPRRARAASPSGPPDDAARFRLGPEEEPAAEDEVEQRRHREEEQRDAGRLGARILDRPLPEAPPAPASRTTRNAPGREAERARTAPTTARRRIRRSSCAAPRSLPSSARTGSGHGCRRRRARAPSGSPPEAGRFRAPRSPTGCEKKILLSSVLHYRTVSAET